MGLGSVGIEILYPAKVRIFMFLHDSLALTGV